MCAASCLSFLLSVAVVRRTLWAAANHQWVGVVVVEPVAAIDDVIVEHLSQCILILVIEDGLAFLLDWIQV